MTETELLIIMLHGFVVFVAASLFVRFLCDEYLRDLELYGLIHRQTPPPAESESPSKQ